MTFIKKITTATATGIACYLIYKLIKGYGNYSKKIEILDSSEINEQSYGSLDLAVLDGSPFNTQVSKLVNEAPDTHHRDPRINGRWN
jgi:hypothetical protein